MSPPIVVEVELSEDFSLQINVVASLYIVCQLSHLNNFGRYNNNLCSDWAIFI